MATSIADSFAARVADSFAARIADLKRQSDETDRSIQQHLISANQLITTLEEIDTMAKYQDWRDVGTAAGSFSCDIASTWAASPHAIPREIKDAMQAAQSALCALDDLIQAHVRKELGDEDDYPPRPALANPATHPHCINR